jgi:hypothetical protein
MEWLSSRFFHLRVRLSQIGWKGRRPLIVWYLAHGQHPAYRLEVVVFGEKDVEQRVVATRTRRTVRP